MERVKCQHSRRGASCLSSSTLVHAHNARATRVGLQLVPFLWRPGEIFERMAVLHSGFLEGYSQSITLPGSGCVKAWMVLRNAGGSSRAISSQLLLPALPPPPLVRSKEELGSARTGSPAHISAKTQLSAAQGSVHTRQR